VRTPPPAWPSRPAPEPGGASLDPFEIRTAPPRQRPAAASPPPPPVAPPRPPAPYPAWPGEPAGTLEPPPIDLRRAGQPEPAEPPPAPPGAPPETRPPWRFTRQDDRIVVAPADTPVRGPIRSVEDRLFSENRPAPAWPEDERAAPEVPPEPAPSAEFATLTLAGIYESQGYLHKALTIYDELHRNHPHDAEIAARLQNLQRRLSGAAAAVPVAPPPVAPPPVAPPFIAPPSIAPAAAPPAPRPAAEEAGVSWRLLDAAALGDPQDTAQRLRAATAAARAREQQQQHTVRGLPAPSAPPAPPARPASTAPAARPMARPFAPPAPTPPAAPPAAQRPPAPPAGESGGAHSDYERFLAYLRSLKP
jgi:hypothetical protein